MELEHRNSNLEPSYRGWLIGLLLLLAIIGSARGQIRSTPLTTNSLANGTDGQALAWSNGRPVWAPVATGSTGTVSSVGASGPAGFTWSGPVTGAGTLTATTPGLLLSNGWTFAVLGSNSLTLSDAAGNTLVISNGVIATMRAATNAGNLQSGTLNVTGLATFSSLSNNGVSVLAGNVTNAALTASRAVIASAQTPPSLQSSAASGPNPMNADGSATTPAQINALFPGTVWSNGMAFAALGSNISFTLRDAANNQIIISNGVIATVRAITNTGNIQSATLNTTGNLVSGNNVTAGGAFSAPSGGSYSFLSRSYMQSPNDGILAFFNSFGADFDRIEFGGNTAAFPGLFKVNGDLVVQSASGTGNTNNLYVAGKVGATNGFFGSQTAYTTNQATMAPNFTLGYQNIVTNAAFTFLVPTGVDPNRAETCVVIVTNSTAADVLVSLPASIAVIGGGSMHLTNMSSFTFFHYGKSYTNCYPVPFN